MVKTQVPYSTMNQESPKYYETCAVLSANVGKLGIHYKPVVKTREIALNPDARKNIRNQSNRILGMHQNHC